MDEKRRQWLCKSGSVVDNVCQAWKTKEASPKACTTIADCQYVNGATPAGDIGTPADAKCECAYNKGGDRFCSFGTGHQDYANYVAGLKAIFSVATLKNSCNTLERVQEPCRSTTHTENYDTKKKKKKKKVKR